MPSDVSLDEEGYPKMLSRPVVQVTRNTKVAKANLVLQQGAESLCKAMSDLETSTVAPTEFYPYTMKVVAAQKGKAMTKVLKPV